MDSGLALGAPENVFPISMNDIVMESTFCSGSSLATTEMKCYM